MTKEPSDPIARFAVVRRELEARWPETRIEPTLARIQTLTSYLGDPQRAYPVIHVTGTNGKSSTCRMIESMLRAFGLKTGLMTSPHLSDLRERIRLDGQPVSIEQFLVVHDEVAPVLALADAASQSQGGPPLSFFEVMTALGFATFADAPVDVAIVEVGLGGTWDATNVADGVVAVITPVGLDHCEYLGEGLGEIAAEKAGIIKPGATVVVARQEPEAADVLLDRAGRVGARLRLQGMDFAVAHRALAVGGQQLTIEGLGGAYPDVYLPTFGAHQADNAAVAVAAVEAFFGVGDIALDGAGLGALPGPEGDVPAARSGGQVRTLDVNVVRAALADVRTPGRLEVVRRSPTVIVDAAHNPHGAGALAAALQDCFTFESLVGVLGILKGKDALGICAALQPVLDAVVVTRSSSPRAMEVEELAGIAREIFGEAGVVVAGRLDDALAAAVALADERAPAGVGGGVLVTGSVTTVAEARLLLGAEAGFEEGLDHPDHAAPRGRDLDRLDPQAHLGQVAAPDTVHLDTQADQQ